MATRKVEIDAKKPPRKASQHIFYDCETHTGGRPGPGETRTHKFRLACASTFRWCGCKATRHERKLFFTQEAFWKWVTHIVSQDRSTVLWAHNAFYDATIIGLWKLVDDGVFKVDFCSLESPPFILRGRLCEREVVILDTMNFWPMPLAKIGESYGIAKQAMPELSASDSQWASYCSNDVAIIERGVSHLLSFLELRGWGGPSYTASATALQAFRSSFVDQPIRLPQSERCLRLERDSFFGGKTEAYFVGDVVPETCFTQAERGNPTLGGRPYVFGPLTEYDVRSLYPYAQWSGLYPQRVIDYQDDGDLPYLKKMVDQYLVVARVLLDTKTTYPVRHERLGSIHATGRFWTTLTTPELVRALRENCIIDVADVETHWPADLFSKWIDKLWADRRDADNIGCHADSLLAKFMMNGLYGCFGRRGYRWERREDLDGLAQWGHMSYADVDTGEKLTVAYMGGYAHVKTCDRIDSDGRPAISEHPTSYPAIAAHVAAYAREHMRELAAIARTHELVYTDTDSLWVLPEGAARVESSPWRDDGKLGHLALKRTGSSVSIHGERDYVWDGHSTISGVRSGSIPMADGTMIVEDWSGCHELLDTQQLDSITVRSTKLRMNRKQRKRSACSDGWSRAWHLPLPGELSPKLTADQ